MLAIAVGGQRLATGLGFVRTHAETTRRVAGVAVGAAAIAIALGFDQRFHDRRPGLHGGRPGADRALVRRQRSSARFAETTAPLADDVERAAASGEPVAEGPRARVPRDRAVAEHAAGRTLSIRPSRQGRARRLLDLLVHQLPAHAPPPEGWDSAYRGRARHRRRPFARVRVRAGARTTSFRDATTRTPLSRRARQRLRDLERVRQPVLAREVPDRPERDECATPTSARARTARRRAGSAAARRERASAANVGPGPEPEPPHDAGALPRVRAARPPRRPGDARPRSRVRLSARPLARTSSHTREAGR